MKTIGMLAGMAWESTVTYYQVINQTVNQMQGGHHSARILMYSVDFEDMSEVMRTDNWDRAAEILSDVALTLKAGGADFLLLATNTMHIVAPQVQQVAGLPLLHIAEVTADRLEQSGISTVGLLGTKFTMEMDFYKDVLKRRGFEVLIPEQEARTKVHNIINEELAFGNFKEESRRIYCDEIDRFEQLGAQGVILGCTEIGLLIQQQHSSLPVFDTAQIHGEEAAKFAVADCRHG